MELTEIKPMTARVSFARMKAALGLAACAWFGWGLATGAAQARPAETIGTPPGGVLWAANATEPGPAGPKTIGLEEFERLRAETNYIVLDVRTPREFTAGHVPGAVNVDVNADDFEKRIASFDKGKGYLVHCATGVRSTRAAGRMSRMGFNRLYNFTGGWNVWKKAGKPAVR